MHAMFLDGALVPADCLVNGSSIARDGACDRVAYVYVELDTHDVPLAEGAPSESFVDDDGRGMFQGPPSCLDRSHTLRLPMSPARSSPAAALGRQAPIRR